uniref:Uncharacterized protein n=1 Tax=Glossina palpalis gambiensis TaxID=67801 RepID=A0A1B0C2B7_9MUSC
MLKRQGVLLSKIIRCARCASSENTNYMDDSVVPIDSKTLFINKTNANILELEKQLFSLEQTEKLTEQISETAAIVRQLAQTTLRIQEKERQHMSFRAHEPNSVSEKEEILDALQKKLLPLKNAIESQQVAAAPLQNEDTMPLSPEPQERNEPLEAKQEVMKSDTEEVPAENTYKVYDLDWEHSDQEANAETQITQTQQKPSEIRQEQMMKEDVESDVEEEYMLNAQIESDFEGEEPSMEKSAVGIKPFLNKSKTELVRPLEDQMKPSVLYAEPEIPETMQQVAPKAEVESDKEEGDMVKTDIESDVEEQQSSIKNTAVASTALYKKYENEPEPVATFEVDMEPRILYPEQKQSAMGQQEKLNPELESDKEEGDMAKTDVESDVEEQQSSVKNTAVASKDLYEHYENEPEPVIPFEVDMEPRVQYREQKQSTTGQQETLDSERESDIEEDYMAKTDVESDIEEQQSSMENANIATKPFYNKYEKEAPVDSTMEQKIRYREHEQSALEEEDNLNEDVQPDIAETLSLRENTDVADRIIYKKYDPDAKPIKSLEGEMEPEVSYTQQKHSEMGQQQMSNTQPESNTVDEQMFKEEPEFSNEEQESSMENARTVIKDRRNPLQYERNPNADNTKKM